MPPKLTYSPRLLLAGVLLLALALRAWGLTWGLPSALHYFSYHPDESVVLETSSVTMNALAGRLLPHFYNYGSLQLYLVCFANTLAALVGAVDIVPKNYPAVGDWWPQWAKMYLIGRMLTVGMGVGTVWAVYAIGLRLWGRRAGLLAALTLAVTPLHTQHSHFLTVDVPATFWGTLSLLWAVRLAGGDPKPLRAAVWAGVFAGLATATKYNMAPAVLPLVAAWFVPAVVGRRLEGQGEEGRGDPAPTGGDGGVGAGSPRPSPLTLLAALAAFVAAFFLACPGALLETNTFLADLRFEAVHVQNTNDPTFRDTGSGFVYHVVNNLGAGLGWPLLLLALVSVVYALWRRERGDGLLAAFALPYYILISLAAVRYARYTIPLLPILALWVGRMLSTSFRRPLMPIRYFELALGGWVLGFTGLAALGMVQQMTELDPRDRALAWLQTNAPATATVAFPAMPWFQTVPISPYFSYYQRGGWRRLTSPDISSRVVYNDKDWDVDTLNARKPAYVVLSEYDYNDPLRLKDPAATAFVAVLRRDYFQALHTQFSLQTIGHLPTSSLPQDMTYTDPIILIYQRKP